MIAVAVLFAYGREILAVRGIGLLIMFHAAVLYRAKRLPYGLEGAAPSGRVTGWRLKALAMAVCAIGLVLALRPHWFVGG
jgi:hypothetical protein